MRVRDRTDAGDVNTDRARCDGDVAEERGMKLQEDIQGLEKDVQRLEKENNLRNNAVTKDKH